MKEPCSSKRVGCDVSRFVEILEALDVLSLPSVELAVHRRRLSKPELLLGKVWEQSIKRTPCCSKP